MQQKRKIRVLRIINRFNMGGPTYNATFLTRFLSDDFETLLVGGMPEEDETDSLHILKQYGIEPLLIREMKRQPSFFQDRAAYKKLKNIMAEFKPDIVHTHASKAGALGRRAANSLGIPVVLHTFHGHVFHSYFGTFKTKIYKSIERRLAAKSSGIIAISEIQKKELSQLHNICEESKIKVIPLGFDLSRFNAAKNEFRESTREDFGISGNDVAVAIVGRLVPVKNHLLFINALGNLIKDLTVPVKVFIVGDGSERNNIEEAIKSLPKSPLLKIELTSWIQDIAKFNAGMDLICLTSNNEGTPVSLIEAQAANIPVITTDVGGVRDIVLEGETGFIVPKNDVASLSDKMRLLIEDENLRKKMSQNGWTFVEHKFHYTTLVKNMEEYYNSLIVK
ncbi:MAG: glycosyltransferase family 4 protein [Flavobacteriia bacterium]